MFNFKQYNFKRLNVTLIVIVCILSLISSYAIKLSGGDSSYIRQLFGLGLGLIIITTVALIDYHFIARFVVIYYIAVIVMLILARYSPLGTDLGTYCYRWIDLKIINLQPSELAKIALILILAVLFTRLESKMNKFYIVLLAGAITIVPTLLIFNQPDLSSSMVMIFIFVVMIFTAGLSYRIILPTLGVLIPSFIAFGWYLLQPGDKFLIKEYQVQRLLAFLEPDNPAYALKENWQQLSSIQAIGTGKLYGKLLSEGASTPRNYDIVGVNESDFIWSVIGEEFGFIGCCIILLLLAIIIFICLSIARKAKDRLGKLIALGISAMFMFQVFANIGVATMILPNTGLPLPFLSNGLSSLISCMIAIGLVLNIGLQQKNNVRG